MNKAVIIMWWQLQDDKYRLYLTCKDANYDSLKIAADLFSELTKNEFKRVTYKFTFENGVLIGYEVIKPLKTT